MRAEPSRKRRVEREKPAESRGADCGEHARHPAKRMKRDEHPRDAGAKKARAKGEADSSRGACRLFALPQREQSGKGQRRE